MVEQRLKAGSPATIEDVLRLDCFELVDGRLVETMPPGFEHNWIMKMVQKLLGDHVDAQGLGLVLPGDTLFQLDPASRYGRGADVAFVRQERIPPGRVVGAFPGSPDLAFEIVSPGDRPADLEQKVEDYLRFGTQAVVVLHPDTRSARVRRPGADLTLGPNDELDLDPVVPGFRVTVRDLFPAD